MKKNILLLLFMLFFVACETGTRYDTNASKKQVTQEVAPRNLVKSEDIEALLDDDGKKLEGEPYYDDKEQVEEITSFSGGTEMDGLEVHKIREGKHEGYTRLVFDIYENGKPSNSFGHYEAKYNSQKKDITVVLSAYRKFTESLPSFSHDSIIEKIYLEKYLDDSGFKFHIKLRQDAKVRIFNLPNPARLIFDIKAI